VRREDNRNQGGGKKREECFIHLKSAGKSGRVFKKHLKFAEEFIKTKKYLV